MGWPKGIRVTTLKIEVLERKPDGTNKVHKTDIPEVSFSIPKVQESLERHFEVLGKLGEQRFTEWTDTDSKVVFVCRLK